MQFNITTTQNQPLTMSSLEISELVGKRHDHVMRDINKMLLDLYPGGAPNFGGTYVNAQNKRLPLFNLDRNHTDCLLTGYSAKARMKVIVKWRDLEQVAIKPPQQSEKATQYDDQASKLKALYETGFIDKHEAVKIMLGDQLNIKEDLSATAKYGKQAESNFILEYMSRKRFQDLDQIARNVDRLKDSPFSAYLARGESKEKIRATIKELHIKGFLIKIKGKYAIK